MNTFIRYAGLKRFRPLLLSALVVSAVVLGFSLSTQAETADGTQTLVFMRHAEKPEDGLGQLNCQGLNRSIALSGLLPKLFGDANYIFAANPTRHVEEGPNDASFAYLRPLLTISPSAIKLGLPVNIDFSANDVSDLASELLRDKYHSAIVYTAWSNGYLPKLINEVVSDATGKKHKIVDDWASDDFDSLVVVSLVWHDGKATVTHKVVPQQLNGGSLVCPGMMPTPL
ncbi:histidine phosphatase family protein [Pseudomonas sp. NA-150]|uniref:histidine phosphatase family protein n=1 Tax=Pseudomonas sp. NA-150 TaxID=3367525 RepID=UPI0037C58676